LLAQEPDDQDVLPILLHMMFVSYWGWRNSLLQPNLQEREHWNNRMLTGSPHREKTHSTNRFHS